MDANLSKSRPRGGGAPNRVAGDRSRTVRLDELSRRIPPSRVADVWLFPPLPDVASSSEFLLFTSYLANGGRALYSARIIPANGTPACQIVVEHGRMPADGVTNVVEGLERRLGRRVPVRHISIKGDSKRWQNFLEQSRADVRTA